MHLAARRATAGLAHFVHWPFNRALLTDKSSVLLRMRRWSGGCTELRSSVAFLQQLHKAFVEASLGRHKVRISADVASVTQPYTSPTQGKRNRSVQGGVDHGTGHKVDF